MYSCCWGYSTFLAYVPLLSTTSSLGSSLFHAAHWKVGELGIQFDVTSCTHVPNSINISNKVINWSPLLETVNTRQRMVIVCIERKQRHMLCIFPLLFPCFVLWSVGHVKLNTRPSHYSAWNTEDWEARTLGMKLLNTHCLQSHVDSTTV